MEGLHQWKLHGVQAALLRKEKKEALRDGPVQGIVQLLHFYAL